jgi:hypothetical protein
MASFLIVQDKACSKEQRLTSELSPENLEILLEFAAECTVENELVFDEVWRTRQNSNL